MQTGGRKRSDGNAEQCILILGDFGGSADEPRGDFTARRVTVDTLEAEQARIAPRVRLDTDGPIPIHEELSFTSLDDFHPDSLVLRIAPLRGLLDLAQRLADPRDEAAALRDAAVLLGEQPMAQAAAPQVARENQEQLFARLLGKPAGGKDERSKSIVESLIREAVGAANQASPSASAAQRREQVLALLTGALRSVLTLPAFRRVERPWRSVHWLLSRLEDDQAAVHILDLPKDALARELQSHAASLDTSPLLTLLQERVRPTAIVADYEFHLDQHDLVLLATVGAVASRLSAPFLAQGDLGLCGCASPDDAERPWDWAIEDQDLAQLWAEIRRHPAARWVGLAAPRFLLRRPFGRRSDPIESFEFEELPSRPAKDAYLWANPAFACAYGVANAGAAWPRQWPTGIPVRVPDLPVVIYDDGSGTAAQAPLELVLTERARTAVEQSGVVPFAGSASADYIAASALLPVSSD